MSINTHSNFDHQSNLNITPVDLPKFNFTNRLIEESTKKCKNYLSLDEQSNIGACQKDLMIASSCVLLRKANSVFGDLRDSVGDCKHEIALAKESLLKNYPSFPIKRMDKWLVNLSLDIHNFC
mmetsp:Transcript_28366/g.29546  ORF Transcript_28366/g.29546 Transcript_28366/m.29546 type:complete len:123 (-) Transcript_28366:3-371(-)